MPQRAVPTTSSSFLVDKDIEQDMPVRSCIDVTTGIASSCVVPQTCIGEYPLAELRRLVLERGSPQGVLQTDQETSIRILSRLASYTGSFVRQAGGVLNPNSPPHAARAILRGIPIVTAK